MLGAEGVTGEGLAHPPAGTVPLWALLPGTHSTVPHAGLGSATHPNSVSREDKHAQPSITVTAGLPKSQTEQGWLQARQGEHWCVTHSNSSSAFISKGGKQDCALVCCRKESPTVTPSSAQQMGCRAWTRAQQGPEGQQSCLYCPLAQLATPQHSQAAAQRGEGWPCSHPGTSRNCNVQPVPGAENCWAGR